MGFAFYHRNIVRGVRNDLCIHGADHEDPEESLTRNDSGLIIAPRIRTQGPDRQWLELPRDE